ncbi:uncharacterized protein LOC124402097 [Silurus meridionalis]|uniref:uncharacterized protein LOC124402097 n=1 Tax=Silurus meridionalis TaxID=175797 RepID=UPI001EEB525C|nr:uncharacterized protein LOC124402097 [Silurus meridionalis]
MVVFGRFRTQMQLSNKEKSARYRQRINSDPNARAEYLARRKESYRRRKQLGMIKWVKSSDLTETERKKKREQWRAATKNYRERKKMAEILLDFVPLSMESTLPFLENADANSAAQERPVQVKRFPLKVELSPLSWCSPDQNESGGRIRP